jgi:GNAT superfamily N-acetyltransferase
MALEIRPTEEADWAEVRDLRLEMLADTPIAFEEHLEAAERRSEEEWRMRAARGSTALNAVTYAAILDGRWVGTMGVYVPAGGKLPFLVAVYVTPRERGRGRGVSDALLAACEDWARQRADTLVLEVHDGNRRARRYYEQRGWVPTGRTRPYPFDPNAKEIEMVKRI